MATFCRRSLLCVLLCYIWKSQGLRTIYVSFVSVLIFYSFWIEREYKQNLDLHIKSSPDSSLCLQRISLGCLIRSSVWVGHEKGPPFSVRNSENPFIFLSLNINCITSVKQRKAQWVPELRQYFPAEKWMCVLHYVGDRRGGEGSGWKKIRALFWSHQ